MGDRSNPSITKLEMPGQEQPKTRATLQPPPTGAAWFPGFFPAQLKHWFANKEQEFRWHTWKAAEEVTKEAEEPPEGAVLLC